MGTISSYAGGTQTFQQRTDTPLKGMKQAYAKANNAAEKIAGGDLDPRPFVELMGAQYSFEANAKVLKVMDEMVGTLLDTVA